MDKVNLYHGDCLIENEHIKDGSVDLIITDLPYGTMQGISGGNTSWKNTNTEWDMAINPTEIYKIANRILRKNGKLILFSQEPYTSRLVTEAISNIPFSYKMSWNKDIYGNALFAKKAPLIFFEDIIVFSKKDEVGHPLRSYTSELRMFTSYKRTLFNKKLGNARAQHFMEGGNSNIQFTLCTESTYNELIDTFNISEMEGFKPYEFIKRIDEEFKKTVPSTFNLWEGNKYKSNILEYKKDYTGYHPTQKPLLLLEDLIKTFSNGDDLVVDLTMGSGSTGVACVNTDRRFTGIEMDDKYFVIAKERIEGAENKDQSDIFDYL